MTTKKLSYNGLNLLGLVGSAYASYAAFALSAHHLSGQPICPVLLSIPACVIVLICYVLITVAWGLALLGKQGRYATIIFAAGFIPAFLLALAGSAGEIMGFGECPHTATGFPKCFISFGFLLGLVVAWGASNILKKSVLKH